MRFLSSLFLLAAGIAVGAAVPAVTERVQAVLAWAGAAPGKSSIKPPDGHDHAAHGPEKAGDGHDHAEAGEDGRIRMSAEQVAGQDIAVAPVAGGVIHRHLLVPGTITTDADRIARVPARVVGTVAEMRKRLGDRVEKGEVVALLDSREVADAKSEYLTALVQADLQKINFERQQKLLNSQATAEASFQNARAAYLENRLRVDLARQKLSALGLDAAEVQAAAKRDEATPNQSSLRVYPIRSPLAGRIVERRVDVGTAVGKEGDPADLYTVADLASVWIELAVPTTELTEVREGARVVVAPGHGDAGQGHAGHGHAGHGNAGHGNAGHGDDGTASSSSRAEGRVVFVSPLLNLETRSARVIVALPNPASTWRPGTFVAAEVQIAEDAVTAMVPKQALQTVEGRKVAFVRTAAGFETRPVETGRADDDAVEITAGLTPGEDIAVANTFLLKAELGKGEAEHGH